MSRLIEAGVSLKRRKEVVPTYPKDKMGQKIVKVVKHGSSSSAGSEMTILGIEGYMNHSIVSNATIYLT